MPITIRLTSDLEARLNRPASQTGRTKAFYLSQIVEEHLDDLEDAFLSEAAWEAFHALGEATIPLKAVKQDLGLVD